MKVPKHIRTALWEAQKHFKIAIRQSNIVREWMNEEGIVDDDFEPVIKNSNIVDSYIDTIKNACGRVDNLIKELEEYLKKLNNIKNSNF